MVAQKPTVHAHPAASAPRRSARSPTVRDQAQSSVAVGSSSNRPRSPNPAAGGRRFRCKELAGRNVAEARLVHTAEGKILLIDKRHNGSCDQVPILAKRERDDRLEVQEADGSIIVQAAVLVVVVLQRYADQRSDRVCQLFASSAASSS